MGKVIRSCRKGKGSVFKAHTSGRQGAVAMKRQDYAERHGYVKGVVKEILLDSGRGAPIARVQFKDPYRFKKVDATLVAPEGMFSGQFIYAGKKGKIIYLSLNVKLHIIIYAVYIKMNIIIKPAAGAALR